MQLAGKPFPGPAKPTHDLIGDQENAVFVAQRPYLPEIVRRILDTTRTPAFSFHQNGRNIARPFEFDHPFYMLDAFPVTAPHLFPPGTAITIWIFDVDEIWRLLRVSRELAGIAARRHGPIGRPVERPVPCNDLVPAGILACQF